MSTQEEMNKLFEDIELTAQTAGFNGFLILQRLGSRWSASYQLDRARAMVRVRQAPLEALCALRETMLELVAPVDETEGATSGMAL